MQVHCKFNFYHMRTHLIQSISKIMRLYLAAEFANLNSDDALAVHGRIDPRAKLIMLSDWEGRYHTFPCQSERH